MPVELGPKEIITPPLRLSFPALFEPKPVAKDSPKLMFMATLLIPPTVKLEPFFACIKAAMLEQWAKLFKLPAKNNPLKDCADKQLDGYEEGWHYIKAKSKMRPSVVDQTTQPLIDPERIYAGCWVRAHLNTFAYDHPQGGKGVSFGLYALQLVRDDARLDGRVEVRDVFDEVTVTGDDAPAAAKPSGAVPGEELFG